MILFNARILDQDDYNVTFYVMGYLDNEALVNHFFKSAKLSCLHFINLYAMKIVLEHLIIIDSHLKLLSRATLGLCWLCSHKILFVSS
jgi:hypothetical protein